MLQRAEHLAREHVDPKSRVACRSEWVAGNRPPHLAALARGLQMTEPGGRWAALSNTIRFADLLQRGAPGLGSDSYLTPGVYSSFELMVRAHGRSSTSSYLLCILFGDVLDLPQGACLDFLCSREREMAVGRYSAPFAVFGIQAQAILLRLTNRKLCIGSHV